MKDKNIPIFTLTWEQFREMLDEAVSAAVEKKLQPPKKFKALTAPQAAEFLGTHAHTVRLYADRGQIPYFKIGNRFMFEQSDLEEFARTGGSKKPTQARAYLGKKQPGQQPPRRKASGNGQSFK